MVDPLDDIRHYSPTMTISQVLKFCEKKDVPVTRAMIQNYIRDGLLPPPINKRLYTHKHLAALVTITRLKSVFDIPAIKTALSPYFDDEGLPIEIYSQLMNDTKIFSEQLKFNDALHAMSCVAELKSIVNSSGLRPEPHELF